MGEKLWGERTVGSAAMPLKDEPGAVVFGDMSIGDVVRLPPDLGGAVKEIVDVQVRDCVCKGGHLSLCYVLTDSYLVYECRDKGFLWCRSRKG